MEKITELLENLENLGDLLPKLDTLTGWVQWLISLAVRVGPICILVLGLIYLLIPPKEANRKAGYRTYFGMGSVMAWNFTQRVSGAIMTLAGLILTIIAFNAVKKIAGQDLMTMANSAFNIIKAQVICALVIYVFMFLLTAVMFNRSGNCRFPGLTKSSFGKLLFKDEPVKVPAKAQPEEIYEEIPEPEYEAQGEQVITADDIVIEGLD